MLTLRTQTVPAQLLQVLVVEIDVRPAESECLALPQVERERSIQRALLRSSFTSITRRWTSSRE